MQRFRRWIRLLPCIFLSVQSVSSVVEYRGHPWSCEEYGWIARIERTTDDTDGTDGEGSGAKACSGFDDGSGCFHAFSYQCNLCHRWSNIGVIHGLARNMDG